MKTTIVSCTTKTVHISGTVGSRQVDISWARAQGVVTLNFRPTTRHSNGFIGRGGARIDNKTVTLDQRFSGVNNTGGKSGESETAKGSVTCTSGSATTPSG